MDLFANWEEALALSRPDEENPVTEMHDGTLENVADGRITRIRSNVHAGSGNGCDLRSAMFVY